VGYNNLYAAGIATARFFVKKFGLKLRISLTPPKVEPTVVDNLISKEFAELREKYSADMLDWKSKYLSLEALFEVSRSQWSEKIEEQTEEIARLKAREPEKGQKGGTE
jgi:hypothetical protein